MATNVSGEFEEALKRLEEIVGKLERESVALDESVAL
jgi:exodeoxyribonuclease VII small subunit